MKNSHTAPLEVLSAKANGTFATEPYEAGWAEEAIGFIYIRETAGRAPKLVVQAQVSVDGSRWLDHHTPPLVIDRAGAHYLALTHFGNWLRLAGEVSGGPYGGETTFVLDFYWVLKG